MVVMVRKMIQTLREGIYRSFDCSYTRRRSSLSKVDRIASTMPLERKSDKTKKKKQKRGLEGKN
jgi:hypothetical protein